MQQFPVSGTLPIPTGSFGADNGHCVRERFSIDAGGPETKGRTKERSPCSCDVLVSIRIRGKGGGRDISFFFYTQAFPDVKVKPCEGKAGATDIPLPRVRSHDMF